MLCKPWRYWGLGLASFCLVLLCAGEIAAAARPAIARAPEPAAEIAQSSPASLDQGRQLYAAGRFAEAAAVWQDSAEQYASQGDRADQALSLSYLSLAQQKLNQWDAAQQAIEQSLTLLETAANSDAILWAQALNTQANLFLHAGQIETAIDTWEQAETYYGQAGDDQGVLGSQLNQAHAWHSLGYYGRSRRLLQTVGQQFAQSTDSVVKVQALHGIGKALEASGDWAESYDVLREGLELAEAIDAVSELSPLLLSLGNVAAERQNVADARYYFEQAARVATHAEVRLDARLNRLRLAVETDESAAIASLAPQIQQQLAEFPNSRPAIYAAVNLADTLTKLPPSAPVVPPQALAQQLAAAVQAARHLEDTTAEAYAVAQLGQLYARQGQATEGIELLQKSLAIGRTLRADAIVSQSAWHLGQALKQTGRNAEAIAAYREAVKALQALRGDLANNERDVQFSFRKSVEPVYRQLVSLLLDTNPDQAALAEVRELIEALQLAELDDFFQDACLEAKPRQIDEIDPKAAVFYSVTLPDRLAVIVSAAGQPLQYYPVPVSQAVAEQTFRDFLAAVHPASDRAKQRRLAQQLYDWLIRPAEAAGTLQDRETLVFVLDGLQQRLPVAAFHDGQQYLIEKYAIALSPGLRLLPAAALTQQQVKAVVGGISEARGGFSPLPNVADEVKDIAKAVPAISLLNQDFTRQRFAKELENSHANVVHLATHGQFGSKQEDTFLLTWDGRLSVRELSELLRSRETTQDSTLELLVLSACDTATGDERAVLGIAGFSVKSGARSTVATLWPVRDRVAAEMMADFYAALHQPSVTKAEAVRRAQLALLAEPDFDAPFFWASFIVVGNWL